MHRYVKTLLQVMLGNTLQGLGWGQVTNTAWSKANTVYTWQNTPPLVLYFGTSWLRAAYIITDLLLCVGRTISSISGELKTSFVSASWEDR